MFSKAFWLDALERSAKTFAQASLAVGLPLLVADGASWSDIPNAASVAAFAGLLSLGFSILSRLRGNPESASLLK